MYGGDTPVQVPLL